MKMHNYTLFLEWTGNKGEGTKNYRSYERSHRISTAVTNQVIEGSSDPAFLGDKTKYNPEELFVASLASCHMLWYLHLCASNNIVVLEYTDEPLGKMVEEKDGSGHFTEVILKPTVIIKHKTNKQLAKNLHAEAQKMCFIANSCNFPVLHQPEILTAKL